MIKKYILFLEKSKYDEFETKYHTIGEYVEEVSNKSEYLRNIVSNYINDIDTDIRIANAVNLLSDFDKKQLFYRISNYLDKGEENKDVVITANVHLNENLDQKVVAGKNIFISFLKCLTALGLKNIEKYSGAQENFLLYYEAKDLEVKKFKTILNRFKSLSTFTDAIEYMHNECGIYYGIKYDSTFEYGFHTDKIIPIGSFKVTKGNLNWLLLLQSPSANSLKKDIVGLNINEIIIFNKIALELNKYNFKYKSKVGPTILNSVITFGYTGVGKWDGDALDPVSLSEIKNNFKEWISKYKWSNYLLFNISFDHPYIYFNIKLK